MEDAMTNEFPDSFTVKRPVTHHDERFMPGDVLFRCDNQGHVDCDEKAYLIENTDVVVGFSLLAIKHATMSSQ